MPERMNAGKFSGLWRRATNGAGDPLDAKELALEAERARREETQQQDRIHALEVQQTELLRQVKELTEENRLIRDAMEGIHNGNLALSATVVKLEDTKAVLMRQTKEKDAEINALKADCMRAQSAISRWRACATAALDCVTGGRYAAACEMLARGLAGKP